MRRTIDSRILKQRAHKSGPDAAALSGESDNHVNDEHVQPIADGARHAYEHPLSVTFGRDGQ